MLNTFSSDITLAIFDLDGTLVNTIADLGNSASYALKKYGFPERTTEEYTRFVGNGTYMLIKRCLPEAVHDNDDICKKVHTAFSEHYASHYADTSYAYENMGFVLNELKKNGVKLCVLTNKPNAFAEGVLNKFFPSDTFDIVMGSREDMPKKPDPTAENYIISQIGAVKERVIHIGDSDVDVFTAHNAGVKCIGCTWGFRSRQSLLEAKADFIADKPEDILKIILKNT